MYYCLFISGELNDSFAYILTTIADDILPMAVVFLMGKAVILQKEPLYEMFGCLSQAVLLRPDLFTFKIKENASETSLPA